MQKIRLPSLLFIAIILVMGVFPLMAKSPIATVQLDADKSSGVSHDAVDTLDQILNFAIPSVVNSVKGSPIGNVVLKFRYRDQGLVSCTYVASPSILGYQFANSSLGLLAGEVVTTDYLSLHVEEADPVLGMSLVSVVLENLEIAKEQLVAPYPRLFPVHSDTKGARVGAAQNCANANLICGANLVFNEPDAYSLQGNEINTGISCLGTGEINSVWYEFTAAVNGVLNFTITPVILNSDYDWAVYDVTNTNCGAIATNPALQVSCNYSGVRGTTGPNGQVGAQYGTPLNVIAGRTYKILVSYYNGGVALTAAQGAGQGFSLNLAASTQGLFGGVPIQITPTSASICPGSSTVLTASGATTGYTWSPATGLNTTNGPVVTASPAATTVYTVSSLPDANGCISRANVTVNVNPDPVIDVNPVAPIICQGSSVALVASGASTYTWSPAAGLNTTTGASVMASPSVTTVYTITGISSATTCVGIKNVTVTVNPRPVISVNPLTPVICQGSSVALTASGANTYVWSPATGLNTATGANVIASPVVTTTYTVTGTSIAGCVNNTTVTVKVDNVKPTVTVNPSVATICNGNSTTLTAYGATTYTWSPATGLNTTTGASVIAKPSVNTTYTVTGAIGACTATKTVTVTVLPNPVISVTPPSASICVGSSVVLTAAGGSSYTWSPATGLNTTTGAVVTAKPAVSTTYTVTNKVGTCSRVVLVPITVNPNPAVNVTPPNATICNGSSVSLTASGATSYLWSPATGLNTTTGATVVASPSVTTTYSVKGSFATGCSASKTVTVNVKPNPAISISPANPVICKGNSIVLTASGGASYTWSPASGLNTTTGATVVANPSVTTTYTVTNKVGTCSRTANVTVTVETIPVITVTPSTSTICPGSSVTLTATGAPNFTWSPATGLNTTTGAAVIASPTAAITYTVKGSSLLGACTSMPVTATVNMAPAQVCCSVTSGNLLSTTKISATQGGFAGPITGYGNFGTGLTGIGDLDRDGVEDMVSTTPFNMSTAASYSEELFVIFMNANGTVKSRTIIRPGFGGLPYTGLSAQYGSMFGQSVASLGDLDGDGNTDIAVGAPLDSDAGLFNGAFWILFLNSDGTVKTYKKHNRTTHPGLTSTLPAASNEQFGISMTNIGDLDHDGVTDMVASLAVPSGNTPPRFYVIFLNTDGTIKQVQEVSDRSGGMQGLLPNYSNIWGAFSEGIGDLDGDGNGEIAVGDIYSADATDGAVYILFMNSNGTVRNYQRFANGIGGFVGPSDTGFGRSLEKLGDLDCDGVNDIAVGSPYIKTGSLAMGGFWIVYLKSDGTVKCSKLIKSTDAPFNGEINIEYDFFAQSMGALGDLNNDGNLELAVSAPRDDDGWNSSVPVQAADGYDAGAVYIVSLTSCSGYQQLVRKSDVMTPANLTSLDTYFSLYPNPSAGETVLEFSGSVHEETVEVVVYNQQGSVVYNLENHNTQSVLTLGKDFSAGIYLVKIMKKGGSIATQIFVKN